MSIYWCKNCRDYDFSPDRHVCPPRWQVNTYGDDLDRPEDWTTVYAKTPQDAAEKACHFDDEVHGDYTIIKQGGISPVRVVPHLEPYAEPLLFNIEAWTERHYEASEIEPKEQE